jgi:hypothetical protein
MPESAAAAVPSVEALSATTMRRTGGRGSASNTRGSEASSLTAGMTTSMVGRVTAKRPDLLPVASTSIMRYACS